MLKGTEKVGVVIKGSNTSVDFDGKAVAKEVSFAIDPSLSPPDARRQADQGHLRAGRLNTLKSCVAPVGKDRPKEFSAKEGTGHTLRVFQAREEVSEIPAR